MRALGWVIPLLDAGMSSRNQGPFARPTFLTIPVFCSYLGGYKHGYAEGDGGEEHEEGGEERRVGPELRPLRLHDEAVPVGGCIGGGGGGGEKRKHLEK